MDIPDFNPDYCPPGYERDIAGPYAGMLARYGYGMMSPEDKAKVCNGIGAADGISKLMPSTIWGLDCTEAGNRHDFDYCLGGSEETRKTADMVFLHNLRVMIYRKGGLLEWPRERRAEKYYVALRIGGASHFGVARKK